MSLVQIAGPQPLAGKLQVGRLQLRDSGLGHPFRPPLPHRPSRVQPVSFPNGIRTRGSVTTTCSPIDQVVARQQSEAPSVMSLQIGAGCEPAIFGAVGDRTGQPSSYQVSKGARCRAKAVATRPSAAPESRSQSDGRGWRIAVLARCQCLADLSRQVVWGERLAQERSRGLACNSRGDHLVRVP